MRGREGRRRGREQRKGKEGRRMGREGMRGRGEEGSRAEEG